MQGSIVLKENEIALKDKFLSPKKTSVRTTKLAKRKKRNHFAKRVGSVADFRNASIDLEECNVSGSKKRSHAQKSNITGTKRKKEQLDKNSHRPSDVWMMINGMKLSYELRDIL